MTGSAGLALRKLQDQAIIASAMATDPRIASVVQRAEYAYLNEIAVSTSDREAINNCREIDYPIVLTVSARKALQTTSFLIDPEQTGRPVTPGEWLMHWYTYQHLALRSDPEHAADLLAGALRDARTLGWDAKAQLVLRLWRHRWIFGVRNCAMWLASMKAEDEAGFQQLIRSEEEAVIAFDQLLLAVEAARSSAKSLDEWLDRLYELSPLIDFALLLHESAESDEGVTRLRYIEELRADLFAVLTFCMTLGVLLGVETSWTDTFLEGARELSDLRAAKRQLSYWYRSRLFCPEFWFDGAVAQLEVSTPATLAQLNAFDKQHLVSILITWDIEVAARACSGLQTREAGNSE